MNDILTQPEFSVPSLDLTLQVALQSKVDNKTKPTGSLGLLEGLAIQIGLIQQTLNPLLQCPTLLVFAGDHGVTAENVSSYPQAVTQQMVMNFLAGGAAINVFARQHGMALRIVDAGVNHQFTEHPELLIAKVAMGTENFAQRPAMSPEQCVQALMTGYQLAQKETDCGCNVMGFGEMGIGNTTAAAALMAVLCDLPVEQCVGRGTGLDEAGIRHKAEVIRRAIQHHDIDSADPFAVLMTFGGFEMAMMAGAMLGAAERRTILLIDGFIATSALLVASRLAPAILDYCVFAHCSDEAGHALLLKALNAKPVLNLNMRLGEGTGAALVYPLLQAAVNFLNEMASFESAQISRESTL